MAATTSKDFRLRFFYFAFACLLYSIWRAVDLLVKSELTGEYEHSPIVTADNTLTLLKKRPESDRAILCLGQCGFLSSNAVGNFGNSPIWSVVRREDPREDSKRPPLTNSSETTHYSPAKPAVVSTSTPSQFCIAICGL